MVIFEGMTCPTDVKRTNASAIKSLGIWFGRRLQTYLNIFQTLKKDRPYIDLHEQFI